VVEHKGKGILLASQTNEGEQIEDVFSAVDRHWDPEADIELLCRWSELLLKRRGRSNPSDFTFPSPDTEKEEADPEQTMLVEARRALSTARRLDIHGSAALAELLARLAAEHFASQLGGQHEETIAALRLALKIVLNQDLQRWTELSAGYRALLDLERSAQGERSARTLETRLLLVTALISTANMELADRELRQCRDIADAQESPPQESAYYFFLVAQLASIHGDTFHAQQFEEQALKLAERSTELTLFDVLALVGIAQVHFESYQQSAGGGDLDRARSCFRRVADLDPHGSPELTVQKAFALRGLGATFVVESQWADASQLLQEALDLVERTFGPLHLEVACAHQDLGRHDLAQGAHESAERHLGRAVEIVEQSFGTGRVPEALGACEAEHRQALLGLREAKAEHQAWQAYKLEMEQIIERFGGEEAIRLRSEGDEVDDELEGRYLAACLAVHQEQPGRALDDLLLVLQAARGPEQKRAATMAQRIFTLCGIRDPEVNERRRRLLPWL
jgi:tetratricopeptide (TPR) repeat protein